MARKTHAKGSPGTLAARPRATPTKRPGTIPTGPVRAAGKPDNLTGQVIAQRFLLEDRLGRGAMGTVYRARHLHFGRPFAIKIAHRHLMTSESAIKRFEREAELAGRLAHVNVVNILDQGETADGLRYLVMDYVEGPTLAELIASGPMVPDRVIALARQLCNGLEHAHEAGLIHRDFKPDNVIVERDEYGEERPRIVDFGIAMLREDGQDPAGDRLTTAGIVLGTPHYMAPEHARGGAVDHRIDLFALGVMLYEMQTGVHPFDGDGAEVARANMLKPVPRMRDRVPFVATDPLLEELTRMLMSKAPVDRPPTARQTRRYLDLIERDRDAAARAFGLDLDHEDEEDGISPLHAAVLRAIEPRGQLAEAGGIERLVRAPARSAARAASVGAGGEAAIAEGDARLDPVPGAELDDADTGPSESPPVRPSPVALGSGVGPSPALGAPAPAQVRELVASIRRVAAPRRTTASLSIPSLPRDAEWPTASAPIPTLARPAAPSRAELTLLDPARRAATEQRLPTEPPEPRRELLPIIAVIVLVAFAVGLGALALAAIG